MKKNIFIGFKLRSRNSLYLMLAFTFLMVHQSFAQNHYCESSSAIYSNLNNEFEASVNVGNAQTGPYYDCLATQPNPSWFHFQISQGGDLEIAIQNSSNIDMDFICWGPYDSPTSPCTGALNSVSVVDCSFSSSQIEYCHVPNAQVGEYYILMITNYHNTPTLINLYKHAGTALFDASSLILSLGSNGPICQGETLNLNADIMGSPEFHWSGPDGFTSNLQNPSIPNVSIHNSGTYRLILKENGLSLDSAFIDIEILLETPFHIADLSGSIQDTFKIWQGEQMKFKIDSWDFVSASWNNGSTGQISSFYAEEGQVIASAINNSGCSSKDTVYLQVHEKAILSVQPQELQVGINEAFSTAIEITNVIDLAGFQLRVDYHTDHIQITNVSLDPFLASSGRQIIAITNNIDPVNGVLTYEVSSEGQELSGVSGDGYLLNVDWISMDLNTDEIITGISIDTCMLFQTDESIIPVEINDGIVVINNCHQADFDCDGDVDILDITMAAYTYGSSTGDPNYNPDYDIDDDGDVDVLDLTAIAFEYGWMANTP